MPRRRRIAKARRQALDPSLWRWLCDLAEPGDAGSEAVRNCVFFGDPMSEAELWATHGPEATATHAAVRPGRRPAMWWRYSAPGAPHAHRSVLGGSGRTCAVAPVSGVPFLLDVDPADPPVLEAEAAFLRRHGLLLPGEARRLRPADFEPVELVDEDAP
jgi:hypothetical protein